MPAHRASGVRRGNHVRRLAVRSEQLGDDPTLVAEPFLDDLQGMAAPSLDAWSTAAALAAVTGRLELMVAVRPTFHHPAILAEQAANIDRLSDARLSLNVVSSGGATGRWEGSRLSALGSLYGLRSW